MDTSIKWIKDLVPGLECTNQEFRDAMTLSGTKVECVNKLDKNLDKIVVGQIVSVERHPDADVWLADTMEVHFQKMELRLKKAS